MKPTLCMAVPEVEGISRDRQGGARESHLELLDPFSYVGPFLNTAEEPNLIDKLYQRLVEVNFSHQVLGLRPEGLGVLKVIGVKGNDLGEPKRVMASLDMAGIRPHWLDTALPQFA
jgi:hypothetical protein